MSTRHDFLYQDDDGDLRPWGWGVCSFCGEDAEEEDYDEDARVTTCAKCRGDANPKLVYPYSA